MKCDKFALCQVWKNSLQTGSLGASMWEKFSYNCQTPHITFKEVKIRKDWKRLGHQWVKLAWNTFRENIIHFKIAAIQPNQILENK